VKTSVVDENRGNEQRDRAQTARRRNVLGLLTPRSLLGNE
jgi:hypothetical protein